MYYVVEVMGINVIFFFLFVYVFFVGGLEVIYDLVMKIKINFIMRGKFYIFDWYFDFVVEMNNFDYIYLMFFYIKFFFVLFDGFIVV